MKILQINSVCGVGSTGRIAVDLHQMLITQNHESQIVYGRGYAPSSLEAIKISSDFDNKIHGIYTRITDKHGFGSKKATKSLIEIINELDPDLIHLHNVHGYYVNIEYLFNCIRILKKPVVWTLHDCWTFTGHCAYFDFADCTRWKTECHDCPQKGSYPSSKLMDRSRWNYRKKKELFTALDNLTFVTPSRWLEGLVKESYFKNHHVVTINNGIDLTVFYPRAVDEAGNQAIRDKFDLKEQYIVLGIASVWEERKGLKYLLELAEKLDRDCRIVIVGISEKQKSELPKNITGITRTNNVNELAELYSVADVFVNPTLEDNFPTTNLESLACGTPVITFNTGGSPESIDETCGIVVNKGDSEGLRVAVIQMRQGPDRTEACLFKAKSFRKEEKFNEYISLYKKVLNS